MKKGQQWYLVSRLLHFEVAVAGVTLPPTQTGADVDVWAIDFQPDAEGAGRVTPSLGQSP
jgi:hypothetical protein